MHCSPGNKITNSQTIAELIDNSYTTSTGGFIIYSNSDSCKITKHKRGYEVVEDLIMYWISEETHEINKDISLLMVNNGEMVKENHELVKDLFSANSGFLSVVEENGIVKEISIKPGYLHQIKDTSIISFESKIYEAGEEIVKDFKISSTSFIEIIENDIGKFFLIRPVIEYKVTQNHPYLKQILTHDTHTILQIDVVQRILVRDGEKIKSSSPVNLLKTYLVLNITSRDDGIKCWPPST
jgi:DNA-directed RNA polymerase subunit beta'